MRTPQALETKPPLTGSAPSRRSLAGGVPSKPSPGTPETWALLEEIRPRPQLLSPLCRERTPRALPNVARPWSEAPAPGYGAGVCTAHALASALRGHPPNAAGGSTALGVQRGRLPQRGPRGGPARAGKGGRSAQGGRASYAVSRGRLVATPPVPSHDQRADSGWGAPPGVEGRRRRLPCPPSGEHHRTVLRSMLNPEEHDAACPQEPLPAPDVLGADGRQEAEGGLGGAQGTVVAGQGARGSSGAQATVGPAQSGLQAELVVGVIRVHPVCHPQGVGGGVPVDGGRQA